MTKEKIKKQTLKITTLIVALGCIIGIFLWDKSFYRLNAKGFYALFVDIFMTAMILCSVFLIFQWIDKKNQAVGLDERLSQKAYQYLPIFLFVFALVLRVLQFGLLPRAMMCDEQTMIYDAWCLAHYGIDRNGHRFPVYLEAWGSGQSALLAYLSIPFVLLFGMNVFSARIVMLITSLLAIWVFYLLTKKIKNKNVAIVALFLFAISPFHIMMSRWGLDCNLLINFLIFALYFLVKSWEDKKHWYFVLACFLFGLCLYCYALSYLLLVLFLVFVYIYLLYMKKIRWSSFIVGNLVLACMALPLLLFLMVNAGWIPAIETSFFSIPKMSAYRSDEIGLSWSNVYHILTFFFELERDFRASTTLFGSLYHVGTIFFIIGCITMFYTSIRKIKNKEFDLSIVIVLLFIANILEAFVIRMNFYKWNAMFICYYCMAGIGMEWVLRYASRILYVLPSMLLVSCVAFMGYYGTFYNVQTNYQYDRGMIEAARFVEDMNTQDKDVEVYSTWEGGMNTMYALQLSPYEVLENIEYGHNKNGWRKIIRLNNYYYHSTCQDYLCENVSLVPDSQKIYIIKNGVCGACYTKNHLYEYFDDTWETAQFYDFIVYYK